MCIHAYIVGGASVGGQSEDDVNVGNVKPTPVAKCRRLPCKGLRCQHGYEHGLDDNGCQTCHCRSLQMIATTTVPLVEPCPQMDCPEKFCPKGMQLDDRGCPTCQCLGCPSLNCPSHLNCRDGYVVDEQTGCERCECNIARDSERLQPIAAVTLPVTEKAVPASKDRELLQASEKSLPVSPEATSCPDPVQCFLQCSEGFAVDAAGCQRCACLEDSRAALHGDGLLCRPVECDISCTGGYGTDENGCEICNCAEKDENEAKRKKKDCPKTECAPQCELKVGKTGCPVCACKEDDVIECDSTALVTCSMYCPGGYDRDSRGCEICECRPLADEKAPDVVTEFVTCAPFDEALCVERCDSLFVIRFDENGCEACECVTGQPEFTTPVLRSHCPALLECTLECPEALERDERGCEICMCRQPEVDERLKETGNAGPEVKQVYCPAIECPLPFCRMVTDKECPRCQCDRPGEIDAMQTGATCPEIECIDTCPGGHRVDEETGCPSCACVDDRSVIVVTSDPFATRDSEFVYEEEAESQEPNPTPYAAWTDAMPEAPPTTLAAPVTDIADPEGYPAEVMCSGRSCNKKCINGLRKSEGEECFICECNPESRSSKRLVDVSVFNARKGKTWRYINA